MCQSGKSLRIGLEKNCYRKKILEPVSKFFRILVLIWVPVSSRSRDFCNFFMVSEPVSKKIWYRKKSRNRSRKKWVPKKSLGIGLEEFWYRKKSRNRSRKNLVPKKSLGIGIVQILGLVTHWYQEDQICLQSHFWRVESNSMEFRWNLLGARRCGARSIFAWGGRAGCWNSNLSYFGDWGDNLYRP